MLALRNVAKTWVQRLAFGVFFAATMALLFLGNTVFENSDRGLATTYVSSFTGQASLSAPSPESFTIFGSDLPLIGQYLALPTLPDADALRRTLGERLPAARYVTQVTAAAKLEIGRFSDGAPVFGVDFRPYFAFFPALKVLSGSLPESSESSVVLPLPLAERIGQRLKRPLAIGDELTLTFAVNTSFITRQVRLAAVFSYPASDSLLDRIVLTDPDTARALAGYLYGEKIELGEDVRHLMTSSIDDLFSDGTDSSSGSDSSGVMSPEELLRQVRQTPPDTPRGGVEGAWNFILVRQEGKADGRLLEDLRLAFAGQPLQIRDWRDTAGGTAQVAWFLRIVFNLGLLFIAVVSCLILINVLSLAILERTKEIGTMRALGAARSFVGGLIAWETLVVVVSMGAVGVAAGVLAVAGVSSAGIRISNEYLAALFGATQLTLSASWSSILWHLVLTLFLGLVSIAVPVRKALSIEPVKAIAREQ